MPRHRFDNAALRPLAIVAAFAALYLMKNWGTDRFTLRGALAFGAFFGFAALMVIAWQLALGTVWPWNRAAFALAAALAITSCAALTARPLLGF